ncbi:hypothetical protein AMTR_s04606p00004600 [Amborella trichopoda]|uniref:Pectate lyase superfamily protein domain-containing protein n=1 Tax=Amborella trichopoda TaxID=13333 RepID=U5CX11_AMBTC|nr:hypothetical protein AMTR_s04606p00004600 [Amborella trichopoda]
MEKARDHLFLILSFSFSFLFSGMAHGSYVVTRFGAQADGISDDSQAFLDAWASACGSFVPATVYVPPGNYLLFPTTFQGPCKNSDIRFKIDGRLVASGRYTVYADAGFWVKFEGVNGVTIDGGLLEARGAVLWACKASSGNCPSGATVSEICACSLSLA